MESDSLKLDPSRGERNRLQFCFSAFLILALICPSMHAWVTGRVNQKRSERQFVAAIVKSGGRVQYDFDPLAGRDRRNSEPKWPGPKWLRQLLGDNFFCEIIEVMAAKDSSDAELAPSNRCRRSKDCIYATPVSLTPGWRISKA